MATGNKPAGEKPQVRKKRRAKASGLDKMRSEADRVLRENSPKIAEALKEKALLGDLKYTELLVKLAKDENRENGHDDPETALMYSYAGQLSKEPEWNADAKEAVSAAVRECAAPETLKAHEKTD
jgi:hypothetical protein